MVAGTWAMAAHGQDEDPTSEGETSSADTFNIPDNITILGPSELALRRPTAQVNGTIITGTDVDQRVALLLAANDARNVPEEEVQRMRRQVLRNVIDETLQIQEAAAQEMAVTPEEVNQSYSRLATERFNR